MKKSTFFQLTLAVQSPMVKKFFGKNGLRCNAKRIFKINHIKLFDLRFNVHELEGERS